MNEPKKVIIEITAEYYSHKVFNGSGQVLWEDKHNMKCRGSSSSIGEDVWQGKIGDNYSDLAESLDELSFGPFGVAGALIDIKNAI